MAATQSWQPRNAHLLEGLSAVHDVEVYFIRVLFLDEFHAILP